MMNILNSTAFTVFILLLPTIIAAVAIPCLRRRRLGHVIGAEDGTTDVAATTDEEGPVARSEPPLVRPDAA